MNQYNQESSKFLTPLDQHLPADTLAHFALKFGKAPARSEMACPSARAGAPLGNIRKTDEAPTGKLSANVGNIRLLLDESTGEISAFERGKTGEFKQVLTRADLLERKYKLRNLVQTTAKGHRVCNCGKKRITESADIPVLIDNATGHSHFGNIQYCGSVWDCPYCSSKICARRLEQWKQVVTAHQAAGGQVFMISATHRHKKTDSLQDQLKALKKAWRGFWRSNPVKRFRKSIGADHFLKTLEITYSFRNGWHGHFHILVLVNGQEVTCNEIKRGLSSHWADYCQAACLGRPSYERGLDVKLSYSAEEYAQKFGEEALSNKTWDVLNELTSGFSKTSRGSSYTPFSLLLAYDALKKSPKPEDQAKAKQFYAVWLEYLNCKKGNMCEPSQGLYKLYEVAELTDQELAACQDTPSHEIDKLTVTEMTALNKFNLVPSYHLAVENGGKEAGRLVISKALSYGPVSRPEAKNAIVNRIAEKTRTEGAYRLKQMELYRLAFA